MINKKPAKKKGWRRTKSGNTGQTTGKIMACLRAAGTDPIKTITVGSRFVWQAVKRARSYCTHKCISHISHDYFDYAILFSNPFCVSIFDRTSFERMPVKNRTLLNRMNQMLPNEVDRLGLVGQSVWKIVFCNVKLVFFIIFLI